MNNKVNKYEVYILSKRGYDYKTIAKMFEIKQQDVLNIIGRFDISYLERFKCFIYKIIEY
jgi:hypothetical protein